MADVYKLPDMPYDYGALEPHISGQIMELHHSKHQAAYVTGANAALDKLEAARSAGDATAFAGPQRALAFNVSGIHNHTIFWHNMSPDGGGEPDGEVAAGITSEFGSFDAFKTHFTAAATTIMGSGWAVLSFDPVVGKLLIEQRYDQQGNNVTGAYEILMLDMWEHAFYLQYKNVKADYANAWWNTVNWENVASRMANASKAGVL